MNKESVEYSYEGFQSYIRNKIKFQRENLKFDDFQTEATFYSDLKLLCQEYYSDMCLNDEIVIKHVNDIADSTRELVKKRHNALNLKMKESHEEHSTQEKPKALPSNKL
jgi:hypothetical protein